MVDAALLSVVGATKEFGDRVKTVALAAADLSLEAGEFVALVGPSGSGKSTLLNLIGLLDRPTAGKVVLAGQDTSDLDDAALTALRGRMLGFVFQFHHLLPAFSALENVMLPEWGEAGFASKDLRSRSERLLREVGLADRMSYRTTICLVVSSNASPSRGRWFEIPPSCWQTNRPETSIRSLRLKFSACCGASTWTPARHS